MDFVTLSQITKLCSSSYIVHAWLWPLMMWCLRQSGCAKRYPHNYTNPHLCLGHTMQILQSWFQLWCCQHIHLSDNLYKIIAGGELCLVYNYNKWLLAPLIWSLTPCSDRIYTWTTMGCFLIQSGKSWWGYLAHPSGGPKSCWSTWLRQCMCNASCSHHPSTAWQANGQ